MRREAEEAARKKEEERVRREAEEAVRRRRRRRRKAKENVRVRFRSLMKRRSLMKLERNHVPKDVDVQLRVIRIQMMNEHRNHEGADLQREEKEKGKEEEKEKEITVVLYLMSMPPTTTCSWLPWKDM